MGFLDYMPPHMQTASITAIAEAFDAEYAVTAAKAFNDKFADILEGYKKIAPIQYGMAIAYADEIPESEEELMTYNKKLLRFLIAGDFRPYSPEKAAEVATNFVNAMTNGNTVYTVEWKADESKFIAYADNDPGSLVRTMILNLAKYAIKQIVPFGSKISLEWRQP